MRDNFPDDWANLKSASKLAELFDNYEEVRKLKPKFNDKTYIKERSQSASVQKGSEAKLDEGPQTRPAFPSENSKSKDREFERHAVPRCFYCNAMGHIKPACPKLEHKKETEYLNNIEGSKILFT